MTITRRSARFEELATRTDEALAARGLPVDRVQVDRLLNHRVQDVALLMGVSARTALKYAPDDLPHVLADEVARDLGAHVPLADGEEVVHRNVGALSVPAATLTPR